jgi:cyanophycinase
LRYAVHDQHFGQRSRQERLLNALERNPGLIGLGIDEGTALVVRGAQLTVIGAGNVAVYKTPALKGAIAVERLKDGDHARLRYIAAESERPAYFELLRNTPALAGIADKASE